MTDLIKEYIRFPTVEHFERFVYTVAYSSRIPSHIKFKKSNILIWRDCQANSLRICLGHPIYSGIVHKFLKENETTKHFRPTSYHVLQNDKETNEVDRLLTVESQIASVELGERSRLNRACQILKDYLYYTTFTLSLEQPSRHNRTRLVDCLESIQGYY